MSVLLRRHNSVPVLRRIAAAAESAFCRVTPAHPLQPRTPMRSAAVLVVLLSSAVASANPGFFATPPVAVDVGAGTPIGRTTSSLSSTELHIGASWASLYWKPTPVDVTFGYVGSFRQLVGGVDNTMRLDGAYAEASYAVENHRHWRTWLGARVETLRGSYYERSLDVLGGAVRLGAEIYSTGVHAVADSRAGAVSAGAFAIGVYVEGTARTLPRELGPMGIGAGVSMRIPLIAAAGS